mgnify:CR=1 FL=1
MSEKKGNENLRRLGAALGQRFLNERCVVLGGAGFLGSHLCEALLREGATVLAVDNLCTSSFRNLGAIPQTLIGKLTFKEVDISNGYNLKSLIEEWAAKVGWKEEWVERPRPAVNYLFNLASPASPPVYERLWEETIKVNTQGVFWALKAMGSSSVYVHASTSEVYGEPEIVPTPESYFGKVDPTSPRSVYDEAKRLGETIISQWARKESRGDQVRIARIFNTYGPRMSLEDGRVVPSMIKAVLRGENLPIFGTGEQTRSFCYVDDLIEGLLRLTLSDAGPGPVNLGASQETTMRQLAKEISRQAGGVGVATVTRPLPRSDPSRRCPDLTRAKAVLQGWEATVSLEDGLHRTIEWARGER